MELLCQLMTNDEIFSVIAQPVETGSLVMMSHSIKHWHRVMGAQQLARCGKVAARGRGQEHLWLRKEDELHHLLHREGEADIHSENVGHSCRNEIDYRSHRRARTHSAGVPRGFRYAVGFINSNSPFWGSIPHEVKG